LELNSIETGFVLKRSRPDTLAFSLKMTAEEDTKTLIAEVKTLSLNQEPFSATDGSPISQAQGSKEIGPQPAASESTSSRALERYGHLWSQYHTLDAATIDPLEQAILHCRVRAFDQARAILDALPTELKHHPVIAFERCQTYWLEWRLKDYLRVLREASAWAEISGKFDNASGIHTLLRIALARAEVLVEGDFTNARDCERDQKVACGYPH
jgi:hypothetical protein